MHKSFFGVFGSPEAKEGLCHYDYERAKRDGYPEAHLQVYGQSETLEALRQGRALAKLHFPVGGRRFRPSLEDLIEFLVREQLVEPKDDYMAVLDAGRQRFMAKQLRAAMRRNPDIVAEHVERHGAPKIGDR
ncbi:hypothetical protein RKE29_19210 [Streptomyces sp. B1866]|uniref:hypothetical protein n=1 Tax=Streptomyces sp. B1866 TaxID=3075431 RepID=UPI0028928EE2|nr:hypothetical protein [Streptomyces sp. B1866]MDT3398748.1 hypothetical protein [Streptomyces sp. B1866]